MLYTKNSNVLIHTTHFGIALPLQSQIVMHLAIGLTY